MKLIIAQGNPGAEYAATRHNVGWQIIDALAAQAGVSFQSKAKFFSDNAEYTSGGEKIILVKPHTFYNETGRAARTIADFYRLSPEDILVIHDDLALPFGTLRTRQGGGHGGNNGLKSLSAHLPAAFWRLRIGILSAQRNQIPDADFVLSRFTAQEQASLKQCIIPAALTSVEQFTRGAIHADTTTC